MRTLRLFDAIALTLVERLRATPNSEASLTLLLAMKERPDLCQKYFQYVPIGLRDATSNRRRRILVTRLALVKAGLSAARCRSGRMDREGEVERCVPLIRIANNPFAVSFGVRGGAGAANAVKQHDC